ncbi:MAG: hypothetical protein A2939_05375 [Parcubacteria group bacterium RIFCSPLOWO2_01_FULL_48_18]|nr:MAG: hypothetical protein A3J67_06595 [Parcubacteria group bacterium RIFCSPHIGHO2_02_FULL_48_10b]OHB22529.1 MAG: hypothetical protein A2939_05375 [Parcubacteria group bacterium RIFCSPLOWO2_01_FULL_48_18]
MVNAKPATQQIVEIKEIKDDIVYLKGGGLRAVIMVSGVNFDLKSEEEQNILLYGYQSFLNSLDYSFQIVVHSRKLNIDGYLEMLRQRELQEQNELLKAQVAEYVEFVSSFVQMNAIMSKTFYAVVPYDVIQVGSKTIAGLGSLMEGGSRAPVATTKEEDETVKITQLEQRVEQVLGGIRRMGLRAVRLNAQELIELYYNLYNPEEKERTLAIAKDMTT